MLKIITIVCAAAGVLIALLIAFWIRSKMGKSLDVSEIFGTLSARNKNFRKSQYLPVLITVVLIGLPIGAGIGWTRAGAYLAGAVVCFVTIMLTGRISVTGTAAASTFALSEDVSSSLKTAYRAGAVMGLVSTFVGLAGLCTLIVRNNADFAFEYASFLGLGFTMVAAMININGAIYSSSFELAANTKVPDASGLFQGTSADILSSLVLSAVAAIILAKQSVEEADVFSTFNSLTSIKFPLIVLAIGLAASAISSTFYRGTIKNNQVKGTTISCFVAAIITIISTVFLSGSMMQNYNYAFAVAAGLIASLILGEIFKRFSSESKVHIGGHKTDRKMDVHAPVVFNLANGMMSTLLFAIVLTASMMISYIFARYYGVALCAVGICCISPVSGALNWMGIISHDIYGIIDSRINGVDENSDTENEAAFDEMDMFERAYSITSVTSGSYSSLSGIYVSLALLMCFIYACNKDTVDILDPFILAGLIGGAAIPFFLAGLTGNSVRITSRVIFALGHDEEGSEGTLRGSDLVIVLTIAFPSVVGFLLGVNALLGLLIGVVLSGSYVLVSRNNAGEYFENDAHRTLGSLIKLTMIFSICYLPLFTKVGGFLI